MVTNWERSLAESLMRARETWLRTMAAEIGDVPMMMSSQALDGPAATPETISPQHSVKS